LVNAANAISAALYDNLSFVFLRDVAAVGGVVRVPNVMEINPAVPVKSVAEFIAYAKANPGKINMAGVNGTTLHLAGELFKMMTGLDMVYVPYKGAAPALADLLGGHVHLLFDNLSSSIEHIKAGKLRALAVTTVTRSKALPGIPTVGEFVQGYEASAWQGIGAPRNTPVAIVHKLNLEINAAFADPHIKARLAEFGGDPLEGSSSDFAKLLSDETAKWARVVKYSGAKPD
jgi:tripartite-type tricarboxylate transporter receptor subunit TctC